MTRRAFLAQRARKVCGAKFSEVLHPQCDSVAIFLMLPELSKSLYHQRRREQYLQQMFFDPNIISSKDDLRLVTRDQLVTKLQSFRKTLVRAINFVFVKKMLRCAIR